MNGRALAAALAWFALSGGAAAATHVVTVEGMQFKPASVTVQRGDTVVWRNKDVVPHTATAAGVFDSKQIAAGKSWRWKADRKGGHGYVCVYHPGMKGTVVVE